MEIENDYEQNTGVVIAETLDGLRLHTSATSETGGKFCLRRIG